MRSCHKRAHNNRHLDRMQHPMIENVLVQLYPRSVMLPFCRQLKLLLSGNQHQLLPKHKKGNYSEGYVLLVYLTVSNGWQTTVLITLYCDVNLLLTYWFIRDVFPTPESPKIITLSKTFFLDAIFDIKFFQNHFSKSKITYFIPK